MDGKGSTSYAPVESASEEEVREQARQLLNMPLLCTLSDAVTDIVIVVNKQRQIVFCNRQLLAFMEIEDREAVLGLRPGEAMECVHASDSSGGCGTAEFCRTCGAVNAVLRSLAGSREVEECRILRDGNEALDLLVQATPLTLGGRHFTICALRDISHEKRRRALERTFFHDLMNTALGLKLLTRQAEQGEATPLLARVAEEVDSLLEQLREQRDLLAAENYELAPQPDTVNSATLLKDLRDSHAGYAAEQECRLRVDPQADVVEFVTDRTMLSRVVGNMIRNALEATDPDGTVTIGCRELDGRVELWTHNPGAMPREVQLQVFQRSFSTKGPGRGLGTYSMKLLTERYLNGTVGFNSSPEDGTLFYVRCPIRSDGQ